MNVLFVCNQGKHRSKTAAEIFSSLFDTRYAGLFSEQAVTSQDLEWAELIFVMEEFQRSEIAKRFPEQYLKKQILVLSIPDVFHYNQPELQTCLRQRVYELTIQETA